MSIKNIATLMFPAFSGQSQNGGYDALTGVAGVDLFKGRAETELEAAKASGNPVSLLVCSLDNLSQITNKFGNKSAEQAIKMISTIVLNHIGEHSKVGRLANDSFAVTLTNSNLQISALKAETIRAAISSISVNGPMADQQFSASIGVSLASDKRSIATALEAATIAVKQASSQEGNRVCLSSASQYRSSNGGAAEEYSAHVEQLRDVA